MGVCLQLYLQCCALISYIFDLICHSTLSFVLHLNHMLASVCHLDVCTILTGYGRATQSEKVLITPQKEGSLPLI